MDNKRHQEVKAPEHRVLVTSHAPAPGNYSQARVIDFGSHTLVYASGQTGKEPGNNTMVSGGIEPQTRQALMNVRAIMEAAGGSLDDVVKVTVFMTAMAKDKQTFESVYRSFFSDRLPARSLVEVSRLPLPNEDTVIEIEAVAVIARQPTSA